MKCAGKYLSQLLPALQSTILLLFMLGSSSLSAATLTSTVDRNRITLDDTLRLTVRSDDTSKFSEPDFSLLENQWEILGRSQSSNMSIVNGRMSSTKDWIIHLAPKAKGRLLIPSFAYGSAHSDPVIIQVSDTPSSSSAAGRRKNVFVETHLDKKTAYVQEQLVLTLRLYHSINLRSLSAPEPDLPNAVVTKIGESQYEKVENGIRYGVYEQRFAIFPQSSGVLTIPTQTFSAQVADNRRGFFSFNMGPGKSVRARTEEKTVTVEPKPTNYAGANWLPAKSLTIEERWSKDPDDIELGEPVTRTLVITSVGLASAQLPPTPQPTINGLKFYPDQPQTKDESGDSGLIGTRQESIAIVANQGGTFTIPEVRIHWWDTESQTENIAKIPARTIKIAGGAPASLPTQNTQSPAPTSTASGVSPGTVTVVQQSTPWLWILTTAAFAVAWVITLVLYIQLKRRLTSATTNDKESAQQLFSTSKKQALNTLATACQANDPKAAREALIQWAQLQWQSPNIINIEQLAARAEDSEFLQTLNELERVLYSPTPGTWKGERLMAIIKGFKPAKVSEANSTSALPALYS